MYKILVKPFLFFFQPENAHHLTVKIFSTLTSLPIIGKLVDNYYSVKNDSLVTRVLGLEFPNPVGLAAGFDKDGKYFETMSKLGFGFIEIGTVTPVGQVGNPQPRLFRLPEDEGLINRMGFNNDGVEALVERLKNRKDHNIIVGGNIGKNKLTPNEEATSDYVKCFDALHPYVDYFVVNVSSPNTPNLRALQDKEPLQNLLATLLDKNKALSTPRPILLKIAPDLTDGQLDDIVSIVEELDLPGIIATNTTIDRSNLKTSDATIENIGNGGLSGKPVAQRSTEVIQYLRTRLPKETIIIGVGGINSAAAALEKIEAGANLIQVYSSMIYEGPTLIKKINKGIIAAQKNA